LARIAKHDPVLNSFTDVTADRGGAKARRHRCPIAAEQNPGPLAGVPYAVKKNLFDVQACRPAPDRRSIAILRRRRATPHLMRRMDAAARGCRGAEYGRIRLRLHRRDCTTVLRAIRMM